MDSKMQLLQYVFMLDVVKASLGIINCKCLEDIVQSQFPSHCGFFFLIVKHLSHQMKYYCKEWCVRHKEIRAVRFQSITINNNQRRSYDHSVHICVMHNSRPD